MTNVVCYKGHNYPVWDVDFGPQGFYFATASHDRTARLWSCDQIYPLRIFAGHMSDVDVSFLFCCSSRMENRGPGTQKEVSKGTTMWRTK